MVKTVFRLVIYLLLSANVYGQTQTVGLSTIKTRSLAMGGAYVSLSDDLAALDFNPAGFSIRSADPGWRYSVFFNPLGAAAAAANWQTVNVWNTALGWIVRGAALSVGKVNIGVLFGEESLAGMHHATRDGFLDGTGYEKNRNTSFGLSFALAQRVSLGVAGELFYREQAGELDLALGYRYGVVVKPIDNLSVGICFIDMPEDYKNDRLALERLANETLNIGVSYQPASWLLLSLDMRNVSDEGRDAALEPHVGFEFIPWRHVAVRGGYYHDWDLNSNTISAGVGLLDWNLLYSEFRRFLHPTFSLNATMIWDLKDDVTDRWFLLSLVIRT